MIEGRTAQTASAFDRLMLLLVGREKSGKSRTAATARKPILVHDHDGRWQSLAGLPDIYIITYSDSLKPAEQPSAFNDHLTILTYLEQGYSLRALAKVIGMKDWERWPDVRPRTNVTDSMSSLGKQAMDYNLYANKDLRREIKVGGRSLFFTNGWDSWNAETASLYSSVMRLVAMKDIDIILTFHETDEQAAGSSYDKKVFTGKKDIFPDRYRIFNKYFSEIWRVSRESGNVWPTIQVTPDFRFAASSNLDFTRLKPEQINVPGKGPNIADMITVLMGGTQLTTALQSVKAV